jgi:hypothetical protein
MTQPTSGDYMLAEGQPVGLVRGYIYDGWYTVDDFTYANGIYTLKPGIPDIATGILGPVKGTDLNKPSGQTAYPGVMKLRNINDSDTASTNYKSVVNEKDVSTIGNMNPKFTGGLTIQGNYKIIDFTLGFNWSYGNKIYNANYLAAYTGAKEDGLYKNRLNMLSSAYKMYDIQGGQLVKVTDPAELSTLNANATTFLPYNENPVVSSLGIQDGSYLRLNTVTIGVSVPTKWLNTIKISKIRGYITVYNAYIWTKYNGLDPEVNTNTHQGSARYPTPGLDFGSYPRARSYIFGLNIEF